jgi:hypothetical protein
LSAAEDEQRRIGARLDEPERRDVPNEAHEPGSWRLTKAVEGFGQQADMIWSFRIFEAWRLAAEHAFVDIAMQERVRNI